MQKRFNDTGLCIPLRHYMVDISTKIEEISRACLYGEYQKTTQCCCTGD